jgi:hypothetical protein
MPAPALPTSHFEALRRIAVECGRKGSGMGSHKDGKTRRGILMAAGAAAAVAGTGASAHGQATPSAKAYTSDDTKRKILAVGVGNDGNDPINKPQLRITFTKTSSDADFNRARPYIKGLTDWLSDNTKDTDLESTGKTFDLGDSTKGYTIDYREASVGDLKLTNPSVFSDLLSGDWDCIVCLSSFVGEVAARLTKEQGLDIPIVVVTSDPSKFSDNPNVCGVCAIRPQLMTTALHKLRGMSGVRKNKIYGLHREDYPPSMLTRKNLGKAVNPVPIADTASDQYIVGKVTDIAKINGAALLVFPVDRFFGIGDLITTAAGTMPTYWSTKDWPLHSTGGYGFPQVVCGQYMGQRVASIWSSPSGKDLPDELFLTIDIHKIGEKP